MSSYDEYPLVMIHPAAQVAVITPIHTTSHGREVIDYTSTPARLPPVTVYTADQEAQYEAKGYRRGGVADANAFQASFAAPYKPGDGPSEWPKMVDGKLMQDPSGARPGPVEWPKWVGPDDARVLVQNEAEEMAWLELNTAPDEPEGPSAADLEMASWTTPAPAKTKGART